MIKGKKILIGITGGIAAYKIATLTRLFVKAGAEVKIIMTPFAQKFITPLTLATLSKNPVYTDFFDEKTGQWHSHVDLALWADLFLIAPATANTIAKMAYGIADNYLLTVYLSSRSPVFVAPAMDRDMYKHPATQRAIRVLKKRGHHIIEPQEGELASGLTGKGRMEEPEKIFDIIENFFTSSEDFAGKKVLITAGPTYEHIDPVRFIGNHSSGKMGYAIAAEFANRGAEVWLVYGPTFLNADNPAITIYRVTSADEMNEKVLELFPKADIAVFAAAVADYKPAKTVQTKIKKSDDKLILELVKNPDIAQNTAKIKKPGQITVGFALETDNEEFNAVEKLKKKKFDFIVLNSLKDKNAGFGYDTNKITIIFPDGRKKPFPLKDKTLVAKDIVDEIKNLVSDP